MQKNAAPVLEDLSPASLAAAVEENLAAWMPLFGVLGEYREDAPPGVKRSIAPGRGAMFNSITGSELEPEQAGAAISGMMQDARRRAIPLMWWHGPLTRPRDLDTRLQAQGWVIEDDSPGMAVRLAGLNEQVRPVEGLSIKHVRDEAGLRDWADALLGAWGDGLEAEVDYEDFAWLQVIRGGEPRLVQAYAAYLDGRPVGTSLLLLAAGVAGIYAVGTHPDARGKGIGALVTLQPLLEARRRGYRAGVLFSSEMGFNVYHRLGFEEVCRIRSYVWSPAWDRKQELLANKHKD